MQKIQSSGIFQEKFLTAQNCSPEVWKKYACGDRKVMTRHTPRRTVTK